MSVGRIFLGDPSLIDFSGHCYEYLASIDAALKRRGIETVWLGNRAVSARIAQETGASGAFTYWCDARPMSNTDAPGTPEAMAAVRNAHEATIAADLQDLDRRYYFKADDILFINTLRHWPLRGLMKWFESLGRDRAPLLVLVLHFTAFPSPHDNDDTVAAMYREAFRRIAESPLSDRIRLFADSDELIAEYREMLDKRVGLAPIPHSGFDGFVPATSIKPKLTVSYVGEARTNKGFQLLPHLVRGIARSPYRERVHFNIQSFSHDPKATFYRQAMGRFIADNVTFFPDQLSKEDYAHYVESADIVLIPYTLDNYYKQTSGIFAEAFALGKVVVAPRGSWMARQVKQFGSGCLFIPEDPQSLLDVVLTAVEKYESLRERAIEAALRWNSFHNADQFVQIVLGLPKETRS